LVAAQVLQLELYVVLVLRRGVRDGNAGRHRAAAAKHILSRRLLHHESLAHVGRSRADLTEREGRPP
jgi:hypothetical protein